MISKEEFVTAIRLIQDQDKINRQFEKALNLVGDGHYVYGTKDKYHQAALLLLKAAMRDEFDYIDWWFYDAPDDFTVWAVNGNERQEWCLKEPGALYDFLVSNYNGTI